MNNQYSMEELEQIYPNNTDNINQNNYYQDIPIENIESKSFLDIPPPYLEMGSGFVIGMAVGYIIKKSFKLILFTLGFSLIIVFLLESQGLFSVNDKVLEESISKGSHYFNYVVSAIKERITSFQSGISVIAGFIIGLKLG